MNKFEKVLADIGACQDALDWVNSLPAEQRTFRHAWATCHRPDWLLWLASRARVDRRLVVYAACDLAEPALTYVPAGEDRPRLSIAAARGWCAGSVTVWEVRAAAHAAFAVDAFAAPHAAAPAAAARANRAATYAGYAASRAAGYAGYAAAAFAVDAAVEYAAATYDADYAADYAAYRAADYAADYAARANRAATYAVDAAAGYADATYDAGRAAQANTVRKAIPALPVWEGLVKGVK